MLKSVFESKLLARLLSGLSCGQSRAPARTVFIRDVVAHNWLQNEFLSYLKIMDAHIIYSTKRFKKFSAIVILVLTLYGLFQFADNPSEYTYFLLPTEKSVIIFTLTGMLIIPLAIFFIFKETFKRGVLKIDNDGIYNDFWMYKKKLVRWEEIENIGPIKYNYNKYLAINLHRTKNNEKGYRSLIYSLNNATIGTPYFISAGHFDLDLEKLETLVTKYYKGNKSVEKKLPL